MSTRLQIKQVRLPKHTFYTSVILAFASSKTCRERMMKIYPVKMGDLFRGEIGNEKLISVPVKSWIQGDTKVQVME